MSFALLFPGQGSQSLGMLSGLAKETPLVQQVFEEASDALSEDLWHISQTDADKLNQTAYTQPAILAASIALLRVWQHEGGPVPNVMAGHSLGEYSALVAASAIEFSVAIKLVHLRGKFMQEAVPEGVGAMMAIIGLDDAAVVAACAQASKVGVVAAVNFNSPGQVVIAGEKAAVHQAGEFAKEQGAKRALPLPVSVPSHCELMQPAAEKLSQVLAQTNISTPDIAVLHNVDVAEHDTPDAIRDALVRQLYMPVRWTETVELMVSHGVERYIECGPGKVLAGLNKRISKDHPGQGFSDLASLHTLLAE